MNIKKKKKKKRANSNKENLIKRKRLVDNFLVNDICVLKENLDISKIYWIPSLKEVIARNSNVANTNCIRMEILDNLKFI